MASILKINKIIFKNRLASKIIKLFPKEMKQENKINNLKSNNNLNILYEKNTNNRIRLGKQ